MTKRKKSNFDGSKFILRGILVCLGFTGFAMVVNMLNMSSDVAVYCGVLMALFTIVGLVKGWQAVNKIGILFLSLLPLGLSACTVIEPGHAGIKVHMTGSDKGVDQLPVVTGRIFYNPWVTDVYEYPTFMQVAKWEKEETMTFNSKEGMQIGADISIGYQIAASKVPAFYVQFRNDDLEGFTHGYLRNVARDSFNEEAVKYTVEEIYGEKKEALFAGVKERINKHVASFGVNISQFGAVGALRLPDAIVQSLNLKIKATQDAMTIENQLRASKAEAEKSVAQAEGAARVQVAQTEGQARATFLAAEANAKARIVAAEAEAKANRAINDSLSTQLLELKRLEVQNALNNKWNGALPVQMVPGSAVPFISLDRK